jgi:dihydroorotate dehydrogenase
MSRERLSAVNERLLHFMAHDRLSLAGTMVAVGVLYLMLSLKGIRRGAHWAAVAVLTSASAGFFSFFLFLGFGYFDPFHAFVSAILFQLLLLAFYAPLPPRRDLAPPVLVEDRAWRLGLWGQLLFIVHALGVLGAGLVISTIGATSVFVPEDLEFMGTTADVILGASPRLVPLIAHDRASLGGMLLASGLVLLLTALWGLERGARWLWWTLLGAGLPAYAAAIGVHLVVGYTSWRHLLPAFLGLGLYLLALALSRPYLR